MKTAIVTGASDGLGFKLSEKLLEQGWRVIGLSRSKPNLEIEHIKVDLTNENDINQATDSIKKKFSSFECLVNCAGVMSVQELSRIDYREMDRLFKINVLAPIQLISNLLDLIKKYESDIVNVASTVGFKAYEKQAAYGASKWALRGVTENLQLELKKTKCRVIGFNPGGFKSRIFEKATGETVDLKAYMEPEHLARLLVYILELPKSLEVSQIIINRK